MEPNSIENVSDTAFWIAHIRAREGARKDALFQDPFAERLAGERGQAIARAIPWNFYVVWTVALRTVIIDDFIRDAVAGGTDTILNLGAGLDSRPYRMDLPENLRWIEADQAGVIAYKQQVLAQDRPHCRLDRAAVDLSDAAARRGFLERALAGSKHALVLTEGVTPYLDEAEVAALAQDLAAQECVRAWVVDYNSPLMLSLRARQKGIATIMRNAPFKFQPEDWEGFYRDKGWKVREMRYFTDESLKRGRALPMPRWRQLLLGITGIFASAQRKEAYRRLAGYGVLERGDAGNS